MPIKKPDTPTLIITGATIATVLLTAYLASIAISNNLITLPKLAFPRPSSITPNPNALYFTNPVTSISSAKITKKSKGAIWVEVTTYPTQPQLAFESKKINLKILLTETTSITPPTLSVPYFKQLPSASPETPSPTLSVDDLIVGELVDVALVEDLRFVRSNNIKAADINRITNSNVISGQIESLSDSTLTMKAVVGKTGSPTTIPIALLTPPAPQTYNVIITPNTEIVVSDPNGSKKITTEDLKVGQSVTVFSANPIVSTSFPAIAIVHFQNPLIVSPSIP